MHAEPLTVLLGTFTRGDSEGVYAVQMDTETGALTEAKLVAELENPGFLTRHPKLPVVYAILVEKDSSGSQVGGIAAYAIDWKTGELKEINRRVASGGTFAHLAVDPAGRRVIAASYGGGYVTAWSLDPDGRLGEGGELIPQTGTLGPNAKRQNAAHPHSVTISPDGRFAWVADLGLDRVLAYDLTGAAPLPQPHVDGDAVSHAGAGPRHSKFSTDGKSFYVLNELDASITVFGYDAAAGTLDERQQLSLLLPDYDGAVSSSEIRTHPNGRFVYAAHRGDSTIVIFSRDQRSGKLSRLGAVPTGGKTPRNFALSPDGAWLIAANQNSDTLTTFKVDAETGALTATGESTAVPHAVCVLF
ncbi:MAG: lactonase family protein [Verrucomicrobiia bacterium]